MKPITRKPWLFSKHTWLAALTLCTSLAATAATPVGGNTLQRETRIESGTLALRSSVNTTRDAARVMAGRQFSTKRFASPALPLADYRPAASAAAELPEIYGCVIYADGWTLQNNEMGVYRIGTSDAVPFVRMGTQRIDATNGGVAVGDTYWACYSVEVYGMQMVYVLSYDTKTWEEKSYNIYDVPVVATGVTYDRVTDKVYGCFLSDDAKSYVFGTVDYAKGKRTAICPLERLWSAVACTRNGVLYAIDELGDLYTVDKTTGAMTIIGKTGLVATNPSSACIDYRSGRMFYALTADPNGYLYEIDLTTARPTLLYHFPKNQEVTGMFIPMPDAADEAPDEVTDLTLDFPAGTLSGKVSFTCPTTTFDGNPATGAVSYVVEADGMTVAQGETAFGAKVEAPVTMSAPGNYTFSVYLYKGSFNGPAVEATMFVGNDLPKTPSLTATMAANGEITLSWEPVQESVNGGYIDLDALTYTVTRYPDGKVLAEGTRQTQLTDTPSSDGALTGYYYTVVARAGGYASAAATSQKFWLGFVTPPYTARFTNMASYDVFTIVDANNDGTTWGWNSRYNALAVPFNRSNNTDDWLISPPLKLQKGKMYMYTATMHTYLGNPETVEIRWGKTPDAKGLDRALMAPTEIKNRNAEDYSFYLLPEEDGIYYVGIHGISPAAESWYLFADAVSVGAGVEADIPDAPTEFTVTPDYGGEVKASITFRAPVTAVNGTSLTTITRIEVRRDGTKITEFANPAPGASLEYTDTPSEAGYHKYDAVAYNATGAGKRVETTVFVGANEPARPTGVKITETSNPGEVTISWNAVSTDKDGKALNPSLVTYTILAAGSGEDAVNVAENISGTSYTFRAVGAGEEQQFVGYAVRAQTAGGTSLMAPTDIIPAGQAYETPYEESLMQGFAATLLRSVDGDAVWSIYDDNSGIPTYDHDGGMAAMFGELYGSDATLYSGKISLKNVTNPALTLYAYNIAGDDADLNEVEISISDGITGFSKAKTAVMSQLGSADGWYPVVVPLEAWAGKEIQFAIRGVTRTRKFTLVDKICVGTMPAYNLRAGMIAAPSTVKPDAEFEVTAAVENMGLETASGYSVALLRNGKEVAKESPEPLACGETAVVRFPQTLTVADDEANAYQVVVEYEPDTDASDNTSEQCRVELVIPSHPSPRNLTGKVTADGAMLEWTEPDLAAAIPVAVTETFDDCTSWARDEAGAWIFVDADKGGIGQLSGYVLPGIDYNSTLAWFVYDDSTTGLPASLTAYSGHKYLSTMFCLPVTGGEEVTYVKNDDWAISPLLFGCAQTIRFMARSADQNTAEETFEVLYSTLDSTDPADFVSILRQEKVPGAWTPYEVKLPEGAKRFAIRYNNTFGLMLNVDDVTYIPAGKSDLEIEGYNIYRDGKRVNTAPVTATTWLDTEFPEKATYAVSALYGKDGESRPGNTVALENSGIDGVVAAEDAEISSEAGAVVVLRAAGLTIEVADAAGRTVAVREGATMLRIPVAPGVYVVKAGSTVAKVVVK